MLAWYIPRDDDGLIEFDYIDCSILSVDAGIRQDSNRIGSSYNTLISSNLSNPIELYVLFTIDDYFVVRRL